MTTPFQEAKELMDDAASDLAQAKMEGQSVIRQLEDDVMDDGTESVLPDDIEWKDLMRFSTMLGRASGNAQVAAGADTKAECAERIEQTYEQVTGEMGQSITTIYQNVTPLDATWEHSAEAFHRARGNVKQAYQLLPDLRE